MKRFRYWFTNVYWYHYKLQTAGVLFAALVIGFTLYSVLTRVTPDVFLTLASTKPVSATQTGVLNGYFTEKSGGDLVIADATLYLPDINTTDWQLLSVSFVDTDRNLFIIGEGLRETFTHQTPIFVPAEEMGLPADPENPYMIPLSGSSLLPEIGLSEEPMFGLVRRPPEERDGTVEEKDAARFENAAQCLRWLLEG